MCRIFQSFALRSRSLQSVDTSRPQGCRTQVPRSEPGRSMLEARRAQIPCASPSRPSLYAPRSSIPCAGSFKASLIALSASIVEFGSSIPCAGPSRTSLYPRRSSSLDHRSHVRDRLELRGPCRRTLRKGVGLTGVPEASFGHRRCWDRFTGRSFLTPSGISGRTAEIGKKKPGTSAVSGLDAAYSVGGIGKAVVTIGKPESSQDTEGVSLPPVSRPGNPG